MLTNKPEVSIKYKGKYGFWRLLNILLFGFLLYGTWFTCYFIYQNIYSTIANANAVTSLKSTVDAYDLDFPAYKKAEAAVAQKKQTEELPAKIKNIFYYNTSTAIYASTNTKQ